MDTQQVEQQKVEVELTGHDGNAFAIMGRVREAMRKQLPRDEFEATFEKYQAEATAGDYDDLLQTTMKYCDVS